MTKSLFNRGPDANGRVEVELGEGVSLQLVSTVLHIRGVEVSKQPFIDEDKNILLWNGEVFGGLKVEPEESDTIVVSSKLREVKEQSQVLSVFKTIQGPWAVMYWQVHNKIDT